MQKPIDFTLNDILAAAKAAGCSEAFTHALKFTLPQEGVYWEHVADDPGGDTCCGVDQPDYDYYRKQMGEPNQPVAKITAAGVASCYYHNHWQPLGCDGYLYPIALALFDDGVNQGNGRSAKCLQRALGVPDDGVLGSGTAAAEHNYVVKHGATALATALVTQRRAVYQSIVDRNPSETKFLRGWLNRCDDLAKAIAAAGPGG